MSEAPNNIIEFDPEADKPHILMTTDDGNQHVIPRSVFDRIGDGDMEITDIQDYNLIARKRVREWLIALDYVQTMNGSV
jgi:hypothetical protein